MTEFQAEQIENLRKQGVGYRSIGTIVGLSRDIVRNDCKSKGLDGYASEITVNIQEQMALGKSVGAAESRLHRHEPGGRENSAQTDAGGHGGRHIRRQETIKQKPPII